MKKIRLVLALLLIPSFCFAFGPVMKAVIGASSSVAAPSITYVGSNVGSADGAYTAAVSSNTYDVGDLVIVAVTWTNGSETISSISDGTNSWTRLAKKGASDVYSQIAWCKIGTAKTGQTITVTFTGSVYAKVTVSRFSGSFQDSPVDKDSGAAGGSNTAVSIATGTLAQASEVVYVANGSYDAVSCTADTADGFTESSDDYNHCTSYKITSATTDTTVNVTLSAATYWEVALASFKTN